MCAPPLPPSSQSPVSPPELQEPDIQGTTAFTLSLCSCLCSYDFQRRTDCFTRNEIQTSPSCFSHDAVVAVGGAIWALAAPCPGPLLPTSSASLPFIRRLPSAEPFLLSPCDTALSLSSGVENSDPLHSARAGVGASDCPPPCLELPGFGPRHCLRESSHWIPEPQVGGVNLFPQPSNPTPPWAGSSEDVRAHLFPLAQVPLLK